MEPASAPRRPAASKFRRLAVTHALMMGGDAAMIVALADSLFFDIDLDAARSRVLLFLAIGFAPFLIVAPLIGPLIDRVAGGRRLVIQLVAVARVVLALLMARYLDALALFPLVFGALVLQKTYTISKSAIVPSTVRSETELVEANSKLGLIAGLTGAVAVIPAAVLLKLVGAPATLVYSALLFGAAFVAATRLPSEVVAADAADAEETRELHTSNIELAATAMTVLRALVGFTFFHLAFWLRSQDQGTVWFAAVVGVSALAAMVGNAVAPSVRTHVREETMLSISLLVCAVAGLGVAVLGGPVGAVVLAGVVNLMASLGRLSFESIVQRDAPGANQGRAFAVFETRFQLAWALGAFLAVAIQAPGAIGFLVVGLGAAGASVYLWGRRGDGGVTRRSRGRARGRAPRSRSGSAPPPDR
ncbi:MAG TPA: MFS transporter [Ilumatobacteraceae bacterium]|nr:MFS transporter [Ilumatobacteraceae bacterium]